MEVFKIKHALALKNAVSEFYQEYGNSKSLDEKLKIANAFYDEINPWIGEYIMPEEALTDLLQICVEYSQGTVLSRKNEKYTKCKELIDVVVGSKFNGAGMMAIRNLLESKGKVIPDELTKKNSKIISELQSLLDNIV